MISDDDRLAADLADEAGRRLLALRSRGGDPSALRHAGDQGSHEFLTAELARRRPGDAVLSEEGADDPHPAGRGAPTGPCTSRCGRRAS